MAEIIIRNYQRADEAAIQAITFRTGLSGEDLTGRRLFDDQRLFFLMFIFYYTRFEPEHCFVAADARTGAVVGFVVGTENTVIQEKSFRRMIPWKILPHVLGVTLWRHPQSFRALLRWQKLRAEIDRYGDDHRLLAEFPAHLHINLLPEYQGIRIGGNLIRHFEAHLRQDHVKGVHLRTSNHNRKALRFYEKMGYSVVRELRLASHPWFDDYALVTFAKNIDAGEHGVRAVA